MNIYKRKKFFQDFKVDVEKLKIMMCPNLIEPISSSFNNESNEMEATFKKEDCLKCGFKKKCLINYDDSINIIKIKFEKKKIKEENIEEKNIREQKLREAKLRKASIRDAKLRERYMKELEEFDKLDYVDTLQVGIIFKRRGQYQKAKIMYMKAIEKNSKMPTAYNNLGKLLYILGEYDASVYSYREAYRRDIVKWLSGSNPQSLKENFYIHMGHAILDEENLKNNKYKKVIIDYKKSISKAGMNFEVKKNIEREYEKMCIDATNKFLEEK